MSQAVELEEERSRRVRAETELHELRMMKDNLGRVSRLVATEMTALRVQCQHEKEEAQRMKFEADEVMCGCHSLSGSVLVKALCYKLEGPSFET
jgi:nitrite reductase/ring-hydroxylating ferredoxin subunit